MSDAPASRLLFISEALMLSTNNKKPFISMRERIIAILAGVLIPVMGMGACTHEVERMIASASSTSASIMESSVE